MIDPIGTCSPSSSKVFPQMAMLIETRISRCRVNPDFCF
ncbi:hypothetical protein TR2A62_3035 [Thalassobium sp. R2A62]|nr:hypothetical protein TR2A62_3035 [Thalassobium sp. R2A62]